jgi:multidrug efflux pump subunit AcrA (membrane-fusion protein)
MVGRLRMPRTKSRRRWALVLTIVVLLGIGGSAAWAATRGKAADPTSTTQVTVSSSTVSQSVSTAGTIEPAHEADLSFAVSGTVTSVSASVGDKVSKGEALAKVGTSQLSSAVSLAKASLTAAKQSLASAESGSSSLQIASAKAQVARAESNLAAAKGDLAAGTLRSTITGTVAAVNVGTGDTVGSSSGGSGGGSGGSGSGGSGSDSSTTADVVVISTSSWVVNASVGSADLASITKGLQAQITPTDATTRVFGTVQSVGIVASSDSTSSATFPVVVAITGNPGGLYAGASANVSIIVKQVSGVLTVPTAALHSQSGKTYVLQVKNGKQVKTFVTIGTTYGASTEIRSGLSAGAIVAVTTTANRGVGGTGGTGGNGTGQGRQFSGGFGGGGFGGGGPVTSQNGGGAGNGGG